VRNSESGNVSENPVPTCPKMEVGQIYCASAPTQLPVVLWLRVVNMLILEQANHIVESTLKERFALAKEGCVLGGIESETWLSFFKSHF
jgi:hypothetical protein